MPKNPLRHPLIVHNKLPPIGGPELSNADKIQIENTLRKLMHNGGNMSKTAKQLNTTPKHIIYLLKELGPEGKKWYDKISLRTVLEQIRQEEKGEQEKMIIRETLDRNKGNILQTAKDLRIDRVTLLDLITQDAKLKEWYDKSFPKVEKIQVLKSIKKDPKLYLKYLDKIHSNGGNISKSEKELGMRQGSLARFIDSNKTIRHMIKLLKEGKIDEADLVLRKLKEGVKVPELDSKLDLNLKEILKIIGEREKYAGKTFESEKYTHERKRAFFLFVTNLKNKVLTYEKLTAESRAMPKDKFETILVKKGYSRENIKNITEDLQAMGILKEYKKQYYVPTQEEIEEYSKIMSKNKHRYFTMDNRKVIRH